jgi:glycosyltransferase involved in cell wall biosynthesis
MTIVLLLTVGIERPSGRRYFALARELARRGHSIRILALHPDLAACGQRRFVCDGVEVWYVGQMHARKSGSVPRPYPAGQLARVLLTSTLGMIDAVRRSPADVYHLGKPQPVNGVAALVGVLLLRGQRFYLDCDDDEVVSNRFRARWQRWVFACWQWLLPRLAAGITVNTHTLAERLQPRVRVPVVYVPNGVDIERFHPPAAAVVAGLRTALGLTGRRVVAYVGTLALHNHPVNLLLDAFARVAQALPGAALLLIGGGEDMPLLRRQVQEMGLSECVSFTGAIDYHAVPAYLALAEISVDPVDDNDVARARSPLKIFESMLLGIPVVTGVVGDRADLLDYGRAGVLVQPGSAEALAHGMLHLLNDRQQYEAMAQAARQHVRRYSWHTLAAAWEEVYGTT